MDFTKELQEAMQEIGISISASALYDFLRQYFSTRTAGTVDDFAEQLDAYLSVHGCDVKAATVIDLFANRGLLSITGTTLCASEQIAMGAGPGAQFLFGCDSRSETAKTAIEAKGDAQIVGSDAAIVQSPDGAISFRVAPPR